MLRYELTPNNAGFILWGDSEALNELHELIHYIVDESPLIKVKDGFMLSLAYDIRKAREGNRRVEQHQYDQHDTYKLYGVELLWPLVLVQSSILRNSMGYIQTDKNQLSVMYAFEYLIESALTESERTTSNDIMLTCHHYPVSAGISSLPALAVVGKGHLQRELTESACYPACSAPD